MKTLLFIAVFMIFPFLLVIGPYLKLLKKNRALNNYTVNHNVFLSDFVYCTKYSKEEIDRILSDRGETEGINYRYDKENAEIALSFYGGAGVRYSLTVEPAAELNENFLRVTMNHLWHPKSSAPYFVNLFFIKRLDAVPIPYR